MLLTLPFLILSAALAVHATAPHGAHLARHRSRVTLSRDLPAHAHLNKRKTCKPGSKGKSPTTKPSSSPAPAKNTKPTSTPKPESKPESKAPPKPTPAKNDNNNNKPSTPTQKAAPPAQPAQAGTIKISVNRCGPSGATTKITTTSGPNGDIDFLNCGLNSPGGWNPPFMGVSDIIAQDLNDALKDPNSPFHTCSQFTDLFYKYAGQFGLKPIMLAAFAMQESTCNPNTVGGGGEQGLMQITKDKCDGAPGGDCKNPDFNIRVGAQFFSNTLRDAGGSLLLAVGRYNGWDMGLTQGKATAARYTSCCLCQNNLDYLQQFFNGWLQNVSPYSMNLGKYHNLDVCPGR